MNVLLKISLGLFVLWSLSLVLYQNRNAMAFVWMIWKRIRLLTVVESAIVLFAAIGFYGWLVTVSPVMKMGWYTLLSSQGGNVFITPIQDASDSSWLVIRFVPVIFFVGFLIANPFITFVEESVFRDGYLNWGKICKQSVKFGFIHMLVGVPIGIGFVLSFVGLFLGFKYKRAYDRLPKEIDHDIKKYEALLVSTTYHTTYNSVLCVILLGYSLVAL